MDRLPRPGRTALADLASGRRLSYAELESRVARLAGALAGRVRGAARRPGGDAVAELRAGETGAAWLVLAEGAVAGPDELRSWLRPRLATFKLPRDIHLVGELPRNATGKILKAGLRRRSAG